MIFSGKVKKFNIQRGYGLIETPYFDKLLFFHLNDITNNGFIIPKVGVRVTFELKESDEKISATNVELKKGSHD